MIFVSQRLEGHCNLKDLHLNYLDNRDMAEAEKKVPWKLNLVIAKRENRVVSAEARKCFVDFVLHILSLPLGTVAKIVSEVDESGGSPACLERLYEGVKVLDDYYIRPALKQCLLASK